MIRALGGRAEHHAFGTIRDTMIADRRGDLRAGFVHYINALNVVVLADRRPQHIVKFLAAATGQLAENLVENDVEPPMLELALIDALDHVRFVPPGQRYNPGGRIVANQRTRLLRNSQEISLKQI